MLKINNIFASVDGKRILNGVDLEIKSGEVHAIMGKNGSGKSTLSNLITGREGYEVDKGNIFFNDESILDWSPESRSLAGIFMSFQYPVVIPGVKGPNLKLIDQLKDLEFILASEPNGYGWKKEINKLLNKLGLI